MSAQPPGAWSDEHVPLTEAEFDALPGHDRRRYEIIHGKLGVTALSGEGHQGISFALLVLMRAVAPRGWRRMNHDTWVRLPDGDLLAPDLVVPRRDAEPVGDKWNLTDLALVVEIVSRSTAHNDRTVKPQRYAEYGVDAFWRIERDPSGAPVFTVHNHPDRRRREYRGIHTVGADERYEVDVPFPFVIDAAVIMELVNER